MIKNTHEIKVLNKYHDSVAIAAARANDNFRVIDIMRGSLLGNPYIMRDKTDAERDRVIAQYRLWLWDHMKRRTSTGNVIGNVIYALAKSKETIYLVCCCKPRKCHGDVIKAAIEWVREQSNN